MSDDLVYIGGGQMGHGGGRTYQPGESASTTCCVRGMEKQPKPTHEDINKYNYLLCYSKSENCWYAAYDADKGAAWYKWDGNEFCLTDRRHLPKDL